MGFASVYLKERALFPQFISEAPDPDTGIIVVVPAYDEPGITSMLESLAKCNEPDCRTEVIIVINAPLNAPEDSLKNNIETLNSIESWKKENINSFFRLFTIMIPNPSVRGWGVGLARKTGMDEAAARFNIINRPDGVILNLDADCSVERNYFVSVSRELLKNSEHTGCSIYFEHPVSGTGYTDANYKHIVLYELHLRYYFQGLAYSGFPYVHHTVGSAIAVKALSYMKAGGMNRRQAGEDFYFIQKLVPAGGYFNLNSTVVYPSPRASYRVPFGTGAMMGKLDNENSSTLLSYNPKAFDELRTLFGLTDLFFACPEKELVNHLGLVPQGLRLFQNDEQWIEKLTEIRNNSSGLQSYKKRFFGWFNMFRIVKYLNYVHTGYLGKMAVEVAASELLGRLGINPGSANPHDLLQYYRMMEKSPFNHGVTQR
jgi:hypothetical protein